MICTVQPQRPRDLFISTKGALSAHSTFEKGNLGLIWSLQNIKIKTFDTHIAPKVKKKRKKTTTERRKPRTSEIPKNRRKPLLPSCLLRRHDSINRTRAPTPGSCQCMRRLPDWPRRHTPAHTVPLGCPDRGPRPSGWSLPAAGAPAKDLSGPVGFVRLPSRSPRPIPWVKRTKEA